MGTTAHVKKLKTRKKRPARPKASPEKSVSIDVHDIVEAIKVLHSNQLEIMTTCQSTAVVTQALCNVVKEKLGLEVDPFIQQELQRFKEVQIAKRKLAEQAQAILTKPEEKVAESIGETNQDNSELVDFNLQEEILDTDSTPTSTTQ